VLNVLRAYRYIYNISRNGMMYTYVSYVVMHV
jgi:hypothetical protein